MFSSRWFSVVAVLVIALALYLRLLGLTWGLNGGYSHYRSYQPDEFVSLRGLLPINLLRGQLQAPEAYFEGTFNYYLWALPRNLHDAWGKTQPTTRDQLPSNEFRSVLLAGRLMSVAFDLAATVLVLIIVVELTANSIAGLLAALLYSVFPMQIIYAHFMRPHVLCNLLCLVVVWLSIKAAPRPHWWIVALTGIFSGLAAATRYPMGVILSIPCLVLACNDLAGSGSIAKRLLSGVTRLFSGPIYWLTAGFLLGLFVGDPPLFLHFHDVVTAIRTETFHYVTPGAGNVLDLRPVWEYFSSLTPYATYPFLWVVIYLGALYLVFVPRLYPIVIPLYLFGALYTFPMAKSYMIIFARQVMILLPLFAIFIGLGYADLARRRMRFPVSAIVIGLCILLMVPSLAFDLSYDQALRNRDERDVLRQDFSKLVESKTAVIIGVSDSGCYFYTVMPGVDPLKSERIKVKLQPPTQAADYFVIGFERPLDKSSVAAAVKQVEAGGTLQYVKSYSRHLKVLGCRVDLSTFPSDMTYPFPTILLFEKRAQARIGGKSAS